MRNPTNHTAILVSAICFLMVPLQAIADAPELATWLRNTNGRVGYNNIPADVQLVRYSASFVYVNSTGIPAYAIGPWPGNPNVPTNQNFVFKIARFPVVNNGSKTNTPLGVIGVWKDGVAIFNAFDGFSYNNQNIWHRIAVVAEASSFDACLCHPAPGGVLHHHQNPKCLYAADTARHSPILGYAFDGFPVYGPQGYANAQGTGGIARMTSSYRLRDITQRHTLPNGTVLQTSQFGPDVSATYPLGLYAEDYEYVEGLGSLDRYNGRRCVTPEYPDTTYAYFVTTNANGSSAYPYYIGPQYNGVVITENTTTGGHVTVSEPVTTYNPPTSVDPWCAMPSQFALGQNYPNPFNPSTVIEYHVPASMPVTILLFDVRGRQIMKLVEGVAGTGTHSVVLDGSGLASGVYFYSMQAAGFTSTRKLLLMK